jgi:hypothetical protein
MPQQQQQQCPGDLPSMHLQHLQQDALLLLRQQQL